MSSPAPSWTLAITIDDAAEARSRVRHLFGPAELVRTPPGRSVRRNRQVARGATFTVRAEAFFRTIRASDDKPGLRQGGPPLSAHPKRAEPGTVEDRPQPSLYEDRFAQDLPAPRRVVEPVSVGVVRTTHVEASGANRDRRSHI